VTREDQPRARPDLAEHAGREAGAIEGQGDGHATVGGAARRADALPGRVAGAVLVVRGQYLVAGLQVERAGDDVDGGGRVRHPGDVGRVGADQRARAPPEELDPVALHLEPLRVLCGQHLARAGAVGAVVEEGDGRVAQEQVAHRPSLGAAKRGMSGRAASRTPGPRWGLPCARVRVRWLSRATLQPRGQAWWLVPGRPSRVRWWNSANHYKKRFKNCAKFLPYVLCNCSSLLGKVLCAYLPPATGFVPQAGAIGGGRAVRSLQCRSGEAIDSPTWRQRHGVTDHLDALRRASRNTASAARAATPRAANEHPQLPAYTVLQQPQAIS